MIINYNDIKIPGKSADQDLSRHFDQDQSNTQVIFLYLDLYFWSFFPYFFLHL